MLRTSRSGSVLLRRLPSCLRRAGRLLPLALAAHAGPAGSAVITVTTSVDENNAFAPNGSCALREAVEAANTDSAVDACAAGSGADVIEVPAGTYTLSLAGAGEDLNQTGDLDVTDDVEIVGAGPGETVVDQAAAGPARVLHVQCDAAAPAAVDVTLRGLRVTGGGLEGAGAGVLIQDCAAPVHATLEDVQVDGNTSSWETASPSSARPGAGVAVDTAGQVTIRDSVVADNTFGVFDLDLGSLCGAGVGITGGGSTLIEDSRIRDNDCLAVMASGSLPSGAGVWTDATTTLRGTTLDGNRAAYAVGGGVYCESALLAIESSTFSGNEAVQGGAFGNGVDGAPGCITQLDSVTVTGNLGEGGGLYNATGTVVVTNSIVAGNQPGGSPDDVSGAFDSGDFNLVGSADGSTGFVQPNDLVGTAAAPVDPLLAALGAGGFAVPTRPPQVGSPALDSGGTTLATDQRGLPRGALGSAPDRGAAELLDASFGVYLDVGALGGTPSSAYAAAATAPGLWNAQNLGSAPALERGGLDTGVTADVASAALGGTTSGATDPARLLLDDAGACTAPQAWSVDFDGLPSGDYLVLVYAPLDPGRSTGDVLVDTTPLASLPGDTLALDAGASFGVVPATVTDGTLAIAGSDAAGGDCAAVAGVQLLPEPGGGAGLAAGLACVALLGRRAGRGRELQGRSAG